MLTPWTCDNSHMWRWHLMSAVSAWAAWQHCTIHNKYSMLKKKTLCLAQQIFSDGCMNQIKIWLPDSNQKILVPLNSRLMWLLSNTNFSRANSNWIPLDKSANIGLVNLLYYEVLNYGLLINPNWFTLKKLVIGLPGYIFVTFLVIGLPGYIFVTFK